MSSDGTRVAIGADNNAGNGIESGHVRVFDYSSSSDEWTQVGSDVDGEAEYDNSGFGVSLSPDGTRVAIGAPGNDGNGSWSGHVRVYELSDSSDTAEWTRVGSEIDGKYNTDSGTSVSMSSDGTIVAIGAPYPSSWGQTPGSVSVFQLSGIGWEQVGSQIDGAALDDQFGSSLSLSSDGTRIAIGARGNDGNGFSSGHVRVYEYGSMPSDYIAPSEAPTQTPGGSQGKG
mmetsp:Transcript_6616/g.13607  ORF Transcript_6616/g.13607 Transcript_6616/m.13607 type:complete len:229 (+) Transcript_6616:96-782(+)